MGLLEAGHAAFNRTIDRVPALIRVVVHQFEVFRGELVEPCLDVVSPSQNRISIRTRTLSCRLEVVTEILGLSLPVPSTLKGQSQIGDRPHETSKRGGEARCAVEDLVDQSDRIIGKILREGIVVGTVDFTGPEWLVRSHRPDLQPEILREGISDRFDTSAFIKEPIKGLTF